MKGPEATPNTLRSKANAAGSERNSVTKTSNAIGPVLAHVKAGCVPQTIPQRTSVEMTSIVRNHLPHHPLLQLQRNQDNEPDRQETALWQYADRRSLDNEPDHQETASLRYADPIANKESE